MEAERTKTKRKYEWFIPKKRSWFVEMVKSAENKGIRCVGPLIDAIRECFDKVKRGAGVKEADGKKINMRSARCYKATKWVQLCREYDCMGW